MQQSWPVFEKRVFWDVEFESIDYDEKSAFVIERVFERGDVQDIRNCRHYYGDERIRQVLTNARWLSKQTLYLACAILGNELTDYKCYTTEQSSPGYLSY